MQRIRVEDYAARIEDLLAPLSERAVEHVPLAAALGRITAATSTTTLPLPPFRNAQMDGYAVRASDVGGAPVDLPVAGAIAAAPGDPVPLAPGSAVRIMTGAPVPVGADAVVPVEDTEVRGDRVLILRGRRSGEFVREAGSDLAAGGALLPAGIRLSSRHLAALAAAGFDRVAVRSRPRVAVVSTGSELVPAGSTLAAGQLPDSNGPAIAAALTMADAEVILRELVTDDVELLAAVLDEAVRRGAELVVTSGGISMGDHEVVRQLLEPRGATIGTVAMQPGGPQAHGVWHGVPVIGVPGNPVSSQLSVELFVAPLLRRIGRLPAAPVSRAALAISVDSPAGRRQYLRGRMLDDGTVTTVAGPSSHLVAALAGAELLIVVPEDDTHLPAGTDVETRGL